MNSTAKGRLAALVPNTAYEVEHLYLYPELRGQPIVWWEPLALRDVVEAWLAPAAGNRAVCRPAHRLPQTARTCGPGSCRTPVGGHAGTCRSEARCHGELQVGGVAE